MLDVYHEIASGRVDQLGQGRERRLTAPGLIGADHALRYTCPEGQFRVGNPRSAPSSAQQSPGRLIHAIHRIYYPGL